MSLFPLSPCVRRCTLDNGICTGCRRTLAEVVSWSSLDDATKTSIMQQLQDRG